MYVRTVYATGDPARIGETLDALCAEAVEVLTAQPGYRGFGLFADREAGKLIMGSWWNDAEAERASDEALRPRRDALLTPFAQTVTIDHWEAVVYLPSEQLNAGAGFRLTRVDVDPEDIDALIRVFQDTTLPGLRRIRGFSAASLLVDRAHGHAQVGALYVDSETLYSSRGPVAAVRGASMEKVQVVVRGLEEFEAVLLDRQPG
ncbi:antibiotic biosynthesis monooxygenase [Kitasatospora camelliae]|uniref:Antibiotic biosynthesis monooxygenase n=1 Tax=Kitasatospora camelliae TaxID=3156397 RepID=A0AAU8K5X1_9ACTN